MVEARRPSAASSMSSDLQDTPVRQMAGLPEVEDIESPSWVTLHQEACARQDKFYTDPTSGLLVMTEVVHRQRGRCCGSGCRHCPYTHENVPLKRRGAKISQPAWLLPPLWTTIGDDDDDTDNGFSDAPKRQALVLFWSTGKDSYLALRALRHSYPVDGSVELVLLTTFDAGSRNIANQEVAIEQAIAQARALELPLFGVPLQRGGMPYETSVRQSLATIRDTYPQGLVGLATGDLHLSHIREWRENAELQRADLGEQLFFPLWNQDYDTLLAELEVSEVQCEVSAVTVPAHGVVELGQLFTSTLAKHASKHGLDAFGERGEFHTLVLPASLSPLK
eukprot:m.98360 g.98360  ORF g.98360 m.98360 type:complete len:336 (+) comp15079_c0_seq1:1122-2129(+)